MPITATNIVNNATANNATAGGTTPLATSYTPTANSSIVVVVAWDNTATPTVTCADSVDGSYTSLTPQNGTNPILDTVDTQKFQCFFLAKCTAGIRNVNVTWSVNTAFRFLKIVEIQGQAQSGPVIDGFSANYQNSPAAGNNLTSGNITNANQPSLVLGISYDSHDATTPPTADTGAGFTQLESEGTTGSCTEIQRITTTGTTAATFGNNAGDQWISFGLILNEVAINPPPTITVQPTNQLGIVGLTATFSVTATSVVGAITYQWKQNGVNAAGTSTNATYTTPTLDLTYNNALYTVDCTDANGTTTSSGAMLTVIIVPAIMWFTA